MSLDLYAILGVSRDASDDEIKAAYRSRAKECHPDSGGTDEAFAELSKAYEILSDALRRAAYDRTGDAGEAEPADNLEARALSIVSAAMTDSIFDSISKGLFPIEDHLAADAVRLIKHGIGDLETAVSARRVEESHFARLADLVESDPGEPNQISPLLRERAAEIQREIDELERTIAVQHRALEIMGAHHVNTLSRLQSDGVAK